MSAPLTENEENALREQCRIIANQRAAAEFLLTRAVALIDEMRCADEDRLDTHDLIDLGYRVAEFTAHGRVRAAALAADD